MVCGGDRLESIFSCVGCLRLLLYLQKVRKRASAKYKMQEMAGIWQLSEVENWTWRWNCCLQSGCQTCLHRTCSRTACNCSSKIETEDKGKVSRWQTVGGKGHRQAEKLSIKIFVVILRQSRKWNVKKMTKAVWAVLYYWVIHDDEQLRHKFFPDGEEYWCCYKRTGK